MSVIGFQKSLDSGICVGGWVGVLNSLVFFWDF